MSLVSFAIRTCLQRALVGKTYAEDRVFDSQITPLDETVPAGQQPIIIISTDDDKADIDLWGPLRPQKRQLEIMIEMVLATFVRTEIENGGEQVEVIIPHTDAGMEASLAFMTRQVLRAALASDDPWAELLKEFMDKPSSIVQRRGANAEKGVRFAARQVLLTSDPIPEPDFGEAIPEDSPWNRLLVMMDADEELQDLAMLLRAEISKGNDLPSWRRYQASRGWTEAEVANAGFAPVDLTATTESGEAPAMTQAIIDHGSVAVAIQENSTNPIPPEG